MKISDAIERTYLKLREEYDFYIALEFINGNYYVYRHKSLYDKATKKRKTESEYIGKITREGAFVKKAATKGEKRLEEAKAIIESYGGKVSWSAIEEDRESIITDTGIDSRILTELSGNARESTSNISKKLGVSESAIANHIRNLEEKFGIKYTIDMTLEQFHHYQFIAMARFIEEKPNFLEIKKLLEGDPRIRLVLSTRGAYDLFIFMFAQGPLEAEGIVYKLRSDELLANYKAEWHVTYHSQSYGFIPFRDKFFDLMEERIWRRERDNAQRKRPEQFFFREYATLRELNQNSKVPFNLIDKKYGLKKDSARYTYNQLLDNESIRNATITMAKPPIKGTAVFILEQMEISKFNNSKKEYLKYRLAEEDTPLNRFIFSGDIGSPYGLIVIAPLYKEGDLEKLESELLHAAKGTKIRTSMVSNIIVGELGYRKIDVKKTHLYKRLQE